MSIFTSKMGAWASKMSPWTSKGSFLVTGIDLGAILGVLGWFLEAFGLNFEVIFA